MTLSQGNARRRPEGQRYPSWVIGTRLPTVRLRIMVLVLAAGLTLSAVMLAIVGGVPGLVVGGVQLVTAVALILRPPQAGTLAVAALALVPAPLAAFRRWTARTPVGCTCLGPPGHTPGFVSLTGLVVLLDLGLVGLAAWSARASMER